MVSIEVELIDGTKQTVEIPKTLSGVQIYRCWDEASVIYTENGVRKSRFKSGELVTQIAYTVLPKELVEKLTMESLDKVAEQYMGLFFPKSDEESKKKVPDGQGK